MAEQTETARDATYSAPALEKGLDILELLARHGRPMGMKNLADEIGRSKSEIFRMVHVLLARGYLSRDFVSDRLTLSNKLFTLGMQTARVRNLVGVAAPVLERFAGAIQQAVHLVVPSRGEAVILVASSGGSDMNFSLRVGYRRPLVDSHSGLVLMAFQLPDARDRMIADCLAATDRAQPLAPLFDRLETVRADGSIVHESRDIVGLTDVCCPILSPNGSAEACLTTVVVSRRNATEDFESLIARQKAACTEISDQYHAYTPERQINFD
jgi:DNA-binding IclR family transcriptional regulator